MRPSDKVACKSAVLERELKERATRPYKLLYWRSSNRIRPSKPSKSLQVEAGTYILIMQLYNSFVSTYLTTTSKPLSPSVQIEPHIVELTKNMGDELGIRIMSSPREPGVKVLNLVSLHSSWVYVDHAQHIVCLLPKRYFLVFDKLHLQIENSIAELSHVIKQHDRLLNVNGISLHNVSQTNAADIIKVVKHKDIFYKSCFSGPKITDFNTKITSETNGVHQVPDPALSVAVRSGQDAESLSDVTHLL